MENANAVNPTPEAASTPVEPAPQAPAAEASPAPAEPVVTAAPEPTFDEATQKYLENQNIKGTPNEIVAELVKRNQQLRNQPKVEAVHEVLKQEPAAPAQPAQAAPHTLSDMDIMTTQMLVEKQYPDVKVDANFYKEMIADGINPMSGQEINLNRVFKYAEMKQKLANADKAIASANQPANIPSPSNTIDDNSPIQNVQTMDKLAAENIILWSAQQERYGKAPHPQLSEAKQFLQDEARKGTF
jgi:hypothetical protein